MLILSFASTVFADDILLKNEYYSDAKPGFEQFVRLQTTNDPDYNSYVNGRYAYSIYVPKEFNIARYPLNRAGCGFSDEHGASFEVYGMHNIGLTLQQSYNEDLNKHPNTVFSAKGQEWYAISYIHNGYVVYEKHFINAQYINYWIFMYPQSLSEKYNSKCEAVESNFIPGWKTGNKIWG